MVLYAMYRKSTPVKDQKLPEHKGDINNENVAPTVTDDQQEVSPQPGDIEIGEKREENKQDQQQQQQPDQKKKEDQLAHDQTELNNNNNININNDNNNKTGERESCEVWWKTNMIVRAQSPPLSCDAKVTCKIVKHIKGAQTVV